MEEMSLDLEDATYFDHLCQHPSFRPFEMVWGVKVGISWFGGRAFSHELFGIPTF